MAKLTASILNDENRHHEHLILFLRRSPCVESTFVPVDRCFQVVQGAGVGFVANEENSDAVFVDPSWRERVHPFEWR